MTAARAPVRPSLWPVSAPLAGTLAVALVIGIALLRAAGGPAASDARGSSEAPSANASDHVTVRIPVGATFGEVVDTLESRNLIARPRLFRIRAQLTGRDRLVKAGTYRIAQDARASQILRVLAQGRVVTHPVTFPEGLTVRAMAGPIAQITGNDSTAVAEELSRVGIHSRWGVPGPGLEGYLFPDTYRFAAGVDVETVIETMVARYRSYWTPERRSLLAAAGMTEQEAVTLASIVQAEAYRTGEMAAIASVYHNRMRTGMPLQADPTVLYALGGHRPRLLYAAIDSVSTHPYNTYAYTGLPPGPIGAPGTVALNAAISPADTDYFYFVARPNGEHIFSRSHRDHLNARARLRREANGTR